MPSTDVPLPEPSYAAGRVDLPLLEQTVGDSLDATVRASHDREALVDTATGRRWTYGELLVDVERVARGLVASGLRTGDRVGLWAPNCAEWTMVQLATAKLGLVLVPLDTGYGAAELERVLQQVGVRTVVVADGGRGRDYPATVREVLPRCPQLAGLVVIGGPSWESLLQDGIQVTRARLLEVQRSLSPDDAVCVHHTSGATGVPKAATLSHRNILNNGYFVGVGCGYTRRDRLCLPVPFSHGFGMVAGILAAVTHGACMVIPAGDPAATLRAVQEEQCTVLYGLPAMFAAQLELLAGGAEPLADALDPVRTALMLGPPRPPGLVPALRDAGVSEVTVCYGMTETSPVSTQTSPSDPLEKKVRTVGRVGPHLELRIVDPDTREVVPRGVQGELCTRGYSVMVGYWEDPGRTSAAIHDGWMATGDLAVMDAEGFVEITGRVEDLTPGPDEDADPHG